MKNLLHDDLSLAEIASAFAGPRPNLLPPLGAPAWIQVATNPQAVRLLAPLRQLALDEANEPLPELTDALYRDFVETGTRLNFERVYFDRRCRLARAAIVALATTGTEQELLQKSVVAKLTAIFEETSWALPAHVLTTTGKDPFRLDLFASETANLMAEMLTVFGSILPVELVARIRERLRYTVFENFATHPEWQWWRLITNNWNAVCHQGIVGAALAVETDVELLGRVLLAAREGLPNFLAGFGSDGGCSEGPGYWSYGFGWFALLNEQLELASGGKLSVFEGDAKIRECALYGPRARLSNGYVMNFADGPARASMNPHVLGYLGRRLNLGELVEVSQAEFRDLMISGFEPSRMRADFFYFARVLLDLPQEIPAAVPETDHGFYFPDLQVLTSRRANSSGDVLEFAAKGGFNEEHHNHNDCGSYILHVNGEPVVTEIGAPEYNASFFGPNRFQHIATRTLGHSLPIINGLEQREGKDFKSIVLHHELGAEHVRLDVDLTGTYPPEAKVAKLVRRMHLDVAKGLLEVADEFVLVEGTDVETAICTNQKVETSGSHLAIISGAVRVNIEAPDTQYQIKTHHYTNHKGQPATITRIGLRNRVAANAGVLRYTLRVEHCVH